MTLKEVIDFVDGIKPNAFSPQQKTVWLNEVEGFVQTEVFLWAIEQIITYEWYDAFSAAKTYAVGDLAEKGGKVYRCKTAITTPGAWDGTEWEETTLRDDKYRELLVSPPHSKVYWTYLTAMIDYANGEYDKYNNTRTMYNEDMGEFMRWFATVYRPADTHGEGYDI